MSETTPTEERKQEETQEVEVDLKPKKPAKLAPQYQRLRHSTYQAPSGQRVYYYLRGWRTGSLS